MRQCGTCLVAPPVLIHEDEEPVLMSYYSDVESNNAVIELVEQLKKCVQTTVKTSEIWLDSWREYSREPKSLWTPKRKAILAKVRKEKPGLLYFDRVLCDFEDEGNEVAARTADIECSFLRIDVRFV